MGNIYVTGASGSFGRNDNDYYTIKYSGGGDVLSSEFTAVGDNWSVSVTPVFNNVKGIGVMSNNLTILADWIAPVVNITSPLNNSSTSDPTPEISFNITDNAYTTLTYQIFVDDVLATHSGSGTVTSGTITTVTILSSLSLGDHNITVRGIDGESNSANQTINLSVVPPVVYLVSPAFNEVLNSSNATFTFNVTNPGETNLNCSFYINDVLNQTNSTTLVGNNTSFDVVGLSEGLGQNWTVNCTNAQNESANDTWLFGVDTIYPLINFSGETTSSGNYTQDWIYADVYVNEINIDTITINLYNTTGLVQSYISSTSPLFADFTNLSDGTYYLNATVNDSANNINSTETKIMILDTTPPAVFNLTPVANTTYNVSDAIEIGANVTDGVAVDVVFVNVTYPDGTVVPLVLGNTSDWYNVSFVIPSMIGRYNVTFVANDSFGNVNNTEITLFVVEGMSVVTSDLKCSNDSVNYYSCANLSYGTNVTHVRVNCSVAPGNVSSVKYNLYNLQDNESYIDNENYTFRNGDSYYLNLSYVLRDSGNWTLGAECSGTSGNLTETDTSTALWYFPFGNISISLVNPVVDAVVQIYEFFTFSANVTCSGGECGLVNVTLDPEECVEVETCENVSVGEECVNVTQEVCEEECLIVSEEVCENITIECVPECEEVCIEYEEINGTQGDCLEYEEQCEECEDEVIENCTTIEEEVCEEVNCTEYIVENCTDIIEENCTIELVCEVIGGGNGGGNETTNETEMPGEEFEEGEILETEEGKDLGEKTEDEVEYETRFLLMEQNEEELKVIFYHDFNGTLPIYIIGNVSYELDKQEADYLENVTLIVELVEGILPQFELHIGEESEVFTFGKVIPIVELKQGNYTLIDRDDMKLDVQVEFDSEESIILRGLEDEENINVILGTNSQEDVSTSIIAVPSLNIENATIVLEKTKGINAIISCVDEDFNYKTLECNDWKYVDVDFAEDNKTGKIEFNVEHFTAYAGGNLTAGETAFLTVWDYNDVGMSNASTNTTNVKIANETIEFFADYYLAKNGTKLSDGNCTIVFSDNSSDLQNTTYNSTYGYFLYERNFTSNGLYTYTIDCTHTTYTDLSESDSIVIGQYTNETKGAVSTEEGDVPFYTTSGNPANCTLKGGESCDVTWEVNATGILDKVYDFFVEVVGDFVGYTNSSHLEITISANDTTDPVFAWGGTTPSAVFNGSDVLINANVEDNVQTDSVWGVVTHPSGFNTSFASVPYNFTNTTETGRYNLTFFANDSSGNNVTSTSWFEVAEALNVTINVSVDVDVDVGVNISSNFTFKLVHPDFGDTIYEIETNGSFNASVPDVVYDIMFLSAFNDTMNLTLKSVNLSANINSSISIDKHKQESDYLVTYGIDTDYEFSLSEMTFSYVGESYDTESNLQLWKCDGTDYDFEGRSCLGTWVEVSDDPNTDGHYFSYDTTSFSGFAIKEYVAPVTTSGGGGSSDDVTEEVVENETAQVVENETGIPEELFDITFTLEDFVIQDSGELTGVVTFESFGFVPTFVNLTFIIVDENGNEVYRVLSNITVTTEEVLRWNYDDLGFLPDGKYIAIFTLLYNVDVFDEFKQDFTIGPERAGITGLAIDWIKGSGKWYGFALFGVGFLSWLIWFLVKKRKKEKEKENG